MSQALARTARIPRLSRFGWLMALYAENHSRLTRLFAPEHLQPGTYLSSIGDGLDAPSICISYGGEPVMVTRMPGYQRLAKAAEDNGVEIHVSPMSKTAAVKVGPGALSLAFAARDHQAH